MSPSLSGDAAGAAVRNSLGLKHLSYASAGGCQPRFAFPTVADGCATRAFGRSVSGRVGTNPGKRHVRPDGGEQGRSDSRHAIKTRQRAEGPVSSAPVDDAPRECRTDTRQTRELRRVRVVQVDALTRQQGTRESGGGARRLAQRPPPAPGSRGRGRVTHQGDVTGRGLRRPREGEADAGAGEHETGEDQSSAAVIHNHNLGLTASATDYQMTQ